MQSHLTTKSDDDEQENTEYTKDSIQHLHLHFQHQAFAKKSLRIFFLLVPRFIIRI